MRELGLAATEFGPDGFLERRRRPPRPSQLASYGLRAVGGFLPVLLHDPGHDPLPEVDRFIDGCLGARRRRRRAGGVHRGRRVRRPPGARRRRLGDAAGQPRPDRRPCRGAAASWPPSTRTSARWSRPGRRPSGCSPAPRVGLCIDTGHLLVGGGDPVAITAAHPQRVVHVHLKDVDAAHGRAGARRARSPSATAVRDGMFRPLGEGDVDIAAMVRTLEARRATTAGTSSSRTSMLDGAAQSEAPYADVRTSLDYLARVAG